MPSLVKTLWAAVQGNPVFTRRLNGWLTIFWVVRIPASLATARIVQETSASREPVSTG